MAGGRTRNLARKSGDTKCDRAGNKGTRSQILANLGHVPLFPGSCPRISSGHVPTFRKLHADRAYYNTGSCVHPRCITGIEITPGPDGQPAFTLIKWGYATECVCGPGKPETGCGAYTLTIQREELEN
ncbi:MAG: hypothetical protein ACYDH8_16760 [Syntrophales bacterium]